MKYKHTESGIKAFEDFYGLINHDTLCLFFGVGAKNNPTMYDLETSALGCTIRQAIFKQIKERNNG